MDGWKYGSKLGIKVAAISASIYWLSGKARKWKYHRLYEVDRIPRFKFIRKFIKGFKAHYRLSFVKCESCRNAVGIDYQSEKHGWEYEGYHIWSCPTCKDSK